MRQWIVLLGFAALFAWAVTKPLAPANPYAGARVFAVTHRGALTPGWSSFPTVASLRAEERRFVRYSPLSREHNRFIAASPGRIPADGTPTVGGIRLPAGHHVHGLSVGSRTVLRPAWSTDVPVADAIQLAARLADAFPRTGLWPVLWTPSDRVGSYMDGGFDARVVEFGMGYVLLSVGSPPSTAAAAQRLAAEYFDLEGPDNVSSTDTVAHVGSVLMGDGMMNDQEWGAEADFSAGTWAVGYS